MRHIVSPTFRTLHTTAFLVITSGLAANTFLPVYVKGARGASTGAAAFAVVFMTVGWTVGAIVASRISDSRPSEFAMASSAVVLTASATAATVLVWLTGPLELTFAAFAGTGFGLGGVSSSGLAVLQAKARPAEMGRVNSAHQFIRTLGFTYGAALGGAVLFGYVAAQLGDVEIARSLLSDSDVVVDQIAVDALARGFAWSTTLAATLTVPALLFAVRLYRESFESTPIRE